MQHVTQNFKGTAKKKKVNRIVDYTKKTLFFLACKIIITIFRLR